MTEGKERVSAQYLAAGGWVVCCSTIAQCGF